MAQTTYEILQSRITDLTNQIKIESDKLAALQNDSLMRKKLAAIQIPVQSGSGLHFQQQWTDAEGGIHKAQSATTYFNQTLKQVNAWKSAIAAQDQRIKDLKADLSNANQEITKYEKDSPVGKAQAAITEKAADTANKLAVMAVENKKTIIVIFGIVVIVTAIIVVTSKLIKKKKTIAT